MRTIYKTKQLTSLDRDGICQAQTTGAAGDLTINGALASGGVWTSTSSAGQRKIGIYSGANLSALTFTVYGTNEWGYPISEAVTGPNTTTVSTTLDFYTVTRVAASGAVGSNVEVGTTGVGATIPYILDQYLVPFQVALMIRIASGATVNVTAQYTQDDATNADNQASATGLTWFDQAELVAQAASADGNILVPVSAVRFVINSGTDAANFVVRQSGAL